MSDEDKKPEAWPYEVALPSEQVPIALKATWAYHASTANRLADLIQRACVQLSSSRRKGDIRLAHELHAAFLDAFSATKLLGEAAARETAVKLHLAEYHERWQEIAHEQTDETLRSMRTLSDIMRLQQSMGDMLTKIYQRLHPE